MPCYSPVRARRSPGGGVELLGNVHEPALLGQSGSFFIPCRRCIGCRLRYAQMWAIRCVHEASLYDVNTVVTLTYDDVHLPRSGSLVYEHFQLFMRRLRKSCAPRRVRFFCGGEYGDDNLRPHFHACIFNYDFPDKTVANRSKGYFHSKVANSFWRMGNVLVGRMSFDSAAYVARYVVKKVYGDLAEDHYRVGTDEELVPEFAHMSLRPGIGMPWLHRFYQETVRDLSVTSKGKRVCMPRTYMRYVESIVDCDKPREELERRLKKLDARPARLLAGERIASARLGLSRRRQ